jgi:hypothetical protein
MTAADVAQWVGFGLGSFAFGYAVGVFITGFKKLLDKI